MSDLALLAAFWAAFLLALASPGPNFAVIAATALREGRRRALGTAFGLAAGEAVWAAGAVLGVSALATRHPLLADILRIGGGGFLLFLGLSSLRAAPRRAGRGRGVLASGGRQHRLLARLRPYAPQPQGRRVLGVPLRSFPWRGRRRRRRGRRHGRRGPVVPLARCARLDAVGRCCGSRLPPRSTWPRCRLRRGDDGSRRPAARPRLKTRFPRQARNFRGKEFPGNRYGAGSRIKPESPPATAPPPAPARSAAANPSNPARDPRRSAPGAAA